MVRFGRRVVLAAGPVIVLALGCGGHPSVAGNWELYVPSDMKTAAEAKRESVPSGTLILREDGLCTMATSVQGQTTSFRGVYKVAGTELILDGKETLASGQRRPFRERGAFSDDFRTVRVNGKDFSRLP